MVLVMRWQGDSQFVVLQPQHCSSVMFVVVLSFEGKSLGGSFAALLQESSCCCCGIVLDAAVAVSEFSLRGSSITALVIILCFL